MKKFFKNLGEIIEPRKAIWKAGLFIVIPLLFIFVGKLLFDPLDSMAADFLKFIVSFFHPTYDPPPGLGFSFLLCLLFLLGIILRYEEKTGKHLLYRLCNLPYIGFLFPTAKNFEFQPCVFWASQSDKKPAAYRGKILGNDGTCNIIIAEINSPPNIFGAIHILEPRYVIRLNMPSSKLISMNTTGATTLPKPGELDPIPWEDETKEEALARFHSFPG